jgi:hypothetical protein
MGLERGRPVLACTRPGPRHASGRDVLRVWRDIGNIGRMGAIKLLAALELGGGHPERAVSLGWAAERHRNEVGGQLPEQMVETGEPASDFWQGIGLQLSLAGR